MLCTILQAYAPLQPLGNESLSLPRQGPLFLSTTLRPNRVIFHFSCISLFIEAKSLHCVRTACTLRVHCVGTACILRTRTPGYSPKNTCHLTSCTAKQQSPHENNQTAFNLVLHCPYEQTTQPCKVRLLRVFRCPWLRSWRRR